MISCNLIGQQGNQMFTICATIAYALRNGFEYHIPAHTLKDRVWKPMFTHLENPNWNPNLPTATVRENGHQYQELGTFGYDPLWKKGEAEPNRDFNIIIDGYRQSLKYFEDYIPEVRKAFGFDKKDYPYKLYGKSGESSWMENTCAIHVRRGDYLMYPDKHPCVTKDYIQEAITTLEDILFERTGVPPKDNGVKYVFFSDDIEWCKEVAKELLNCDNPDIFLFSENQTELMDFELMMNCKNFIISNSTFSLMAAILSESPNKIVISPDESNWFGSGNAHLDVSDLIPKEYIRIKY
jgi:hypothetical protein